MTKYNEVFQTCDEHEAQRVFNYLSKEFKGELFDVLVLGSDEYVITVGEEEDKELLTKINIFAKVFTDGYWSAANDYGG